MSPYSNLRYITICVFVFFITEHAVGQELGDYEDLLQRVDTIENPVYMPVISVDYGSLNFVGDVKNALSSPIVGNPGYKVSLTTFIDKNQHFAADFFFLTGKLSGNQRSSTDISKNLNFSSNIYSIGASVRYDFAHLIDETLKFRPYLSIGIEQLNFDTKGDLYLGTKETGKLYHYWPDGTIRNMAVDSIGSALPLERDYEYETDLRTYKNSQYNPRSIGVPLGIGFSMDVSERISISVGTEYHYTFTDFIDNVSSSDTEVVGDRGNDGFFYTMATLHFDLFSEPKTKTVDLLFAEVELDPIFYDDEDGDFIIDHIDRCPGTPYGVITDSLGCPFDNDNDGVANYMDKEKETPAGNWVDEKGVTLNEEDLLSKLNRETALKREDVDAYMALYEDKFKDKVPLEIPEKFVAIDLDGDAYISFDELLKVIDSYFDFKIDLSLDELRQVNEFFFSQ